MRTVVLIGPTIREYRRAYKITSEDLARGVGVSASYVRLIEQGRRTPSPEVAEALLINIGCEVDTTVDPWVVECPDGERFLEPVPNRRRTADLAAERDTVQVRIAAALERIADALEDR